MFDNIFLQVLNMSFTASIVILFVIVLRLLLKSVPKIFSYALWSVVLFRLVCPFSFESIFSLLPTKAAPISRDIVYMTAPKIDTGISLINNAVNSSLPAGIPYASMNPLQVWVFVGSAIWIVGIAVLLIYSVVSLLKLRNKLTNAVHEGDNIYLVEGFETPFVLGVFRPKIYLPITLSAEEKKYIILHEQIHIKRFDHVVKLISFFIVCVHWFNPLVWLAFFLSNKDMEMSCDEAVIKKLGSDIKKDYSSSLLALTTSKRIVGGIPLAFGEGDTKSRITNVLNYKKPTFWVIAVTLIAVITIGVALLTNPKDEDMGFAGVNAIILEIDKENQTMTVEGIDNNSVIGDKCIITWEGEPFITVATNSEPKQLSLDDFAIGDNVVLFIIGDVQESYPTRAKATTIQLQPKEIQPEAYAAEQLWQARTRYVGDNSAIAKLIGLLLVPEGLQYDHFKLYTSEQPYEIEIVYSVSSEVLKQYDTVEASKYDPFRKNALILLALVDNADGVRAMLTDGKREVGFINGREWADYTVGEDVRNYAESLETMQRLIDMPIPSVPSTPQQQTLTFWVKPDEPPQIIGEVAAAQWLNSYKDDNVPETDRIIDYTIKNVTVLAVDMAANEKDRYDYIIHIDYNITNATSNYNSLKELYIKSLGGGNYEIVFTGAPAPEYQAEILAAHIFIDGNTLYLDEVEIVTTEDEDRITELGLTVKNDLPSGYHIHNPVTEIISYELTDDTEYTFTDYELLYVKEADGNRVYVTTEVDEFINGSSYQDIPLQEPEIPRIPYFLELHDGKVISITEKFIYTQ